MIIWEKIYEKNFKKILNWLFYKNRYRYLNLFKKYKYEQ